jgi:hypothetical protein
MIDFECSNENGIIKPLTRKNATTPICPRAKVEYVNSLVIKGKKMPQVCCNKTRIAAMPLTESRKWNLLTSLLLVISPELNSSFLNESDEKPWQ